MGTAEALRRSSGGIWERILAHPFVQGIGDGSLPLDSFTFFLRQDYLYLIDYARVLAIASAKAPDLEGMRRFSELLHATLSTEMDLHRTYCAEFGITGDQLEATPAAPGTLAYTRYLLSVAYEGSIAEIAASLLPCQWGYSEIGLELARTGDTSEANRYASWIGMYASREFEELADWLRGYLDTVAPDPPPAQRRRLEEVFLLSSRYEYLFWEMGWSRQGWPV